AREMVVNVPHPLAGPEGAALIASPMKFTGTPVQYRYAPPMIGQQTDEVLREQLGLGDGDLDDLREKGIIG
ncbi:MAG: CoA transferase, partial [Alphaproteobacteria bacterium]